MSERVVAIHQPNFLPWLGFFDKMARSDVFVLLDHVQFQKTGGTWTNRVKMEVGGAPRWVTVPVVRTQSGTLPITDVRIDDARPWRAKTLQTIRSSYGKAPRFGRIFPRLEALLEAPGDRLADLNIRGIEILAEELELSTSHVVRSSQLDVSGAGTDLLVDIGLAVKATTYLTGGGAAGYQDDSRFASAGIAVEYQEFRWPLVLAERPVGLSTVDALMHYEGETIISDRRRSSGGAQQRGGIAQ